MSEQQKQQQQPVEKYSDFDPEVRAYLERLDWTKKDPKKK
jgi:hypothetical protein